MKFKNIVKTVVATELVLTAINAVKLYKAHKLSMTPENLQRIEDTLIEGVVYNTYLTDHVRGLRKNAAVSTVTKRIYLTRELYADKTVLEAVLSHEVGHAVHKHEGTSNPFILQKKEWEADNYAVSQGNLEGLLKFRKETLKVTWSVPFNYNNLCLAKLLVIKYLKK